MVRGDRQTYRATRDLRGPKPRDHISFPGGEFIAIEGPHAGLRIRIDEPLLTIGRESDNSIPLSLDASVSRRHAVVEWVENKLFIRDRSSTNGTRVNGKLIQGRMTLSNLDIIKIGRSALQLIYDTPAEPDVYVIHDEDETQQSDEG